jgi:hypothetical protein
MIGTGFQATIQDYQAPAVQGDFASTNPFSSVLAGPGALIAPAGGLIVGNFAWVGPLGQVSQSFVAGYQLGFCGRNEQALIVEYLGQATLLIPAGFMVNLLNAGDFWALFPGGATVGGYVFADPNDGTPLYSASTSAPTLGTATAQSGSTISSATTTASSAVLTVTTVTNGNLFPGDVVSDTGTPGTYITAGTTILNQLTGTPGKAGTYTMSAVSASAGAAFAAKTTSNQMLVTAIADGSLNVGDVFSGTDVIAGSAIISQIAPFSGVASIITGSLSTLVVTSVTPGTDLLRVAAKLPAIAGLGIAAGTTISAQVSGTPGGVGSYTLSAAGTVGAGVPVTTEDSLGGTGVYTITPTAQNFGASSATETITVAGTAQSTGFRVAGIFSPPAAGSGVGGQLAKITSY